MNIDTNVKSMERTHKRKKKGYNFEGVHYVIYDVIIQKKETIKKF